MTDGKREIMQLGTMNGRSDDLGTVLDWLYSWTFRRADFGVLNRDRFRTDRTIETFWLLISSKQLLSCLLIILLRQ